MTTFTPSETLRAQDEFFRDLCRLREAIALRHPKWIVTPAELGVQATRTVLDEQGNKVKVQDRVHRNKSLHYERLAVDLNLFVPAEDGRYRAVTYSDAPEWVEVHDLWLTINKLNRVMPSTSADANHISRGRTGDPRI